jgi:hypothetical protein
MENKVVHKWIQKAKPKKGALHRQLGYPTGTKIPKSELIIIKHAHVGDRVIVTGNSNKSRVKVTPLLKKRANFALNVRR